jgi:hypothetical protein
MYVKAYPKSSLVEVEETFTNIILVGENDDDDSPPESSTSRQHVTWTVLSRLDSLLTQDHLTCVCEEVSVQNADTNAFCAYHYYLQVSETY